MGKFMIKTMVLGSVWTNVYLIWDEETKEALVIDPADGKERICAEIEHLQLTPKAILLTHGHFDHIGAADALRKQYGIPIYANKLEEKVLGTVAYNLSGQMGTREITLEADHYLEDGQCLTLSGFKIRAISTPGHTCGGMSYLIKNGEKEALFSGDTLFYGSVGRYDFPTSDGKALFASITEKLMALPDELEVYPGHGKMTTIGRERPNFG